MLVPSVHLRLQLVLALSCPLVQRVLSLPPLMQLAQTAAGSGEWFMSLSAAKGGLGGKNPTLLFDWAVHGREGRAIYTGGE